MGPSRSCSTAGGPFDTGAMEHPVGRHIRFATPLLSLGLAALIGTAAPAWAQSRPLQTEDPETIGTGMMLVEAGTNYEHSAVYPASGLTGNLWRVGTFGLNFGVSPIAEIQIKGGLQDYLSITSQVPAPNSGLLSFTGTSTHDFEDAIIGAKVRLASETASRPAIAIKFSTRLPNESTETGL